MSFLGNGMRRGAHSVIDRPRKLAHRKRVQPRESAPEEVVAEQVPEALTQSRHPLQRIGENWREGLRRQQGMLSSHLQDSAQFLQRCIQKPLGGSSNYLAANCFPPRLVATRTEPKFGTAEREQSVVCQGSRSFFNLKIYDFAIFLDAKQAKQSQLGRRYANLAGGSAPQDSRAELKVTQGIRDSADVEMSLMVRASRNLPIMLLTNEYKRILERRLQVVGGNKGDPALRAMLEKFSEQALPEDIKKGGSVKKGTVIAFARDSKGGVRAWANGHDLVEVQSEKLAQAVFDIYLGDTVVCKNARRQAGDNFIKMLGQEELPAPQDSRICNQDTCQVGRLK